MWCSRVWPFLRQFTIAERWLMVAGHFNARLGGTRYSPVAARRLKCMIGLTRHPQFQASLCDANLL